MNSDREPVSDDRGARGSSERATKPEDAREQLVAHCASCGSRNIVPIAYGFPAAATVEAYERGEIEFGGCIIRPHNPTHRCRDCGAEYTA